MTKFKAITKQRGERGMALLLALFALLLLSAIGLCMILASDTETRIDRNYSGSLRGYYDARSGMEEVRDRISFPANTPNSLANQLPQDVAGNPGGVLYVLNPAGGEVIDPTDPNSPYFDDQLCHDYNSGVAANDTKCNTVPGTPKWNLTPLPSVAPPPGTPPSAYKWVRINMKTNRTADPYFVDQTGNSVPKDTRVCWDGEVEQLSPGGPCDANGMQQVYMLTSLAASAQAGGPNGTHKLLRFEVMQQSIRPPGAITMEVGSSANATPVAATFNSALIPVPAISIDGRAYGIDGLPSPPASTCHPVAALAGNTAQGTASLQNSLNALRLSIVQAANSSCNADGSSTGTIGTNNCTSALAWVRGTDPSNFRFSTASSSSPTSTPTPTPVATPVPMPTPTPVPSQTLSNQGPGNHEDSDDHPGPTPTPAPKSTPMPTPTPTPTPTPAPTPSACDASSTATCYTNLDLTAPQLGSTSPLFAGNPGNSGDPLVYQAQSAGVVANENQAVLDYIAAVKASNNNYYEVASTSLAATYGSLNQNQPAVVVITDSSLKLANPLTGYGILEVPNDFEINSNLQWTGIVLVRSSSGTFLINASASGFINGALMLQSGNQFSINTSNAGTLNTSNAGTLFSVKYSCEAIDFAMGSRPLKVVAQGETN